MRHRTAGLILRRTVEGKGHPIPTYDGDGSWHRVIGYRLADRLGLLIKLGSGSTIEAQVVVVLFGESVAPVVGVQINMARPAERSHDDVPIKLVEKHGVFAPVNEGARFRIAEAAIFERHHGTGKELALAGPASEGPVYPYQCAVCLKELKVVRQTAGTGIAVQHMRELHREAFGVVAVVVVPLTDDIPIRGVQRNIPERAEGQAICLGIDKAYGLEGKVLDVATMAAEL
jgi:hypothetical protein